MNGRFVLDASITLAWCFDDETNAWALKVLDLLEEGEAVVPALWTFEVGNALIGAERRGRLTQAETHHFLSLLRRLPIRVEEVSQPIAWGEVLSLARLYHLSTYDAAYLELAMRHNLPIATLDDALRQAATQCQVRALQAG